MRDLFAGIESPQEFAQRRQKAREAQNKDIATAQSAFNASERKTRDDVQAWKESIAFPTFNAMERQTREDLQKQREEEQARQQRIADIKNKPYQSSSPLDFGDVVSKIIPSFGKSLEAFRQSAANAVSAGTYGAGESLAMPERYEANKQIQAENPKSSFAGTAVVSLVPFGAASKVVSKLPLLGNFSKDAVGQVARVGVQEGLAGLGLAPIIGLNKGIAEKMTPSETAKEILNTAMEYGLGGLTLGGLGTAIGIKGGNVLNKLASNKATNKALSDIDNAYNAMYSKGISSDSPKVNTNIPNSAPIPFGSLQTPLLDRFTTNSLDDILGGYRGSIEGNLNGFDMPSYKTTTGADMPLKYQNISKQSQPLLLNAPKEAPISEAPISEVAASEMPTSTFEFKNPYKTKSLSENKYTIKPETLMVTKKGRKLEPTTVVKKQFPRKMEDFTPQRKTKEILENSRQSQEEAFRQDNPYYVSKKFRTETVGDTTRNIKGTKQNPTESSVIASENKTNTVNNEIKTKLADLETNYRNRINTIKNNKIIDADLKSKQIKAEGMKYSAEKRALIQGDSLVSVEGGLTPKELANRIKYLKSNYSGKKVITPDGEGVATGQNSFGKVGVKVNGKVNYYKPNDVRGKIDIDAEIAKQKSQATSQTKNNATESPTMPSKSVGNINSPSQALKPSEVKIEANRANVAKNGVGKDINASTKMETASEISPAATERVRSNPSMTQAQSKTKTSQFRTNTIERSDLRPESKNAMPEELFDYPVESSAKWQDEAINNVSKDMDAVVNKIKESNALNGGVQAHEAAIITKELEKEAIKTGNFTKLVDWVKTVANKTRESARALKGTDTAWQKEPSSGKALMQAQRNVEAAEEALAKSNPKKSNKIKSEAKSVVDAYKKSVDKIISDMVDNDGYKLLKIDLQMFAKKIDKMKEYMKKYYTSDPLAKGDVIKNITKEFGLTGDEAKNFEAMLTREFDKRFQKQAEQYLNNLTNLKGKQNVTLEKVMKLIKSGAYSDEAVTDIIKQKYGLPVLTEAEAQTIVRKMNNLNKMDKNSDAYRLILGQVKKIIADKSPVTLRQKFRGTQRLVYLTNPKTLLSRNPIGNIILNTAENVKDVPGFVIDKITSAVMKSERTTLGGKTLYEKLGWQAEGAKKGFRDWLLDIKYGVDTSPTRGQLELPQGRTFDTKWINSIDDFVRKSLQLGDRPFYEAAYNSRIKELMKIRKLSKATELEEAEARLFALDKVFQNDSVLAKKAAGARDILGIVGDLVIPFTQTPANVLDKLIDYSGGGLVKGLFQIGKTTLKGAEFNQKLFVDRMARTFTGGGLIALGYAFAKKGIIEGGPDKNADARSFYNSMGKTPYSIKLGNKTLTFDWAQPTSGLLAMGADAYKAGKSKEDLLGKISAGTGAGLNTMFKQSFLQGAMNLLTGYSPAASIGKTITETALGLTTPTAEKQIARIVDTTEREIYDSSTYKQRLNNIIKNIPFASKTLPAKKDVFGNEIKREDNSTVSGAIRNVFNNMFNPGNLRDFKPNEVQKEIIRVYEKTGKNVFPNIAEKEITVNGEKYPLSSEQYVRYQELMGKYAEYTMKQVMASKQYSNPRIDDTQKVSALQKIIRDSKDYADDILMKEMGLKDAKKKRKPNPIKIPDNSNKKIIGG